MFAWFDVGDGRKVFRRVREQSDSRSHLPCPMLVRSFAAPVQSMADGKWYDTPRDLEKTYKPSGNPRGEEFISLGNETLPTVEYVPDAAERRADIRQAVHDVMSGNISPEIAAIA